MTIEDCYVKKIECGIRGIKLGTKKPSDVNIADALEKLKVVNDGLYEDLLNKYLKTMESYSKRIENKR
jgi:hypothetical protein